MNPGETKALIKTAKQAGRAAVISYTDAGAALAERLCDELGSFEMLCMYQHKKDFQKTSQVLDIEFAKADLIIFISAAGIAVRQIAPYLQSKAEDPAVLVMDEKGIHVISLVSGHLGGANAWCREIAALLRADPVITTATDLEERFAVDLFAKKNHLLMEDITKIKEVSSRLLRGLPVAVRTDAELEGELPEGLIPEKTAGTDQPEKAAAAEGTEAQTQTAADCEIEIVTGAGKDAAAEQTGREVCRLYAENIYLGIGCRKGWEADAIRRAVNTVLEQYGIHRERIRGIASIDLKKDEAGILELASELGVPFVTYSADQLNTVPGSFSSSEFVRKTTGTDSVSERSALYTAGIGARLIVAKTALDGVTVAAAAAPVKLRFE